MAFPSDLPAADPNPELPLGDPHLEPTPARDEELEKARLRAERAEAEAEVLRRGVEAERTRFDDFIARAPAAQVPATPVPRIEPSSVPDPAEDLDGFRAHQAAKEQRDREYVDGQLAQIRGDQQAEALWTRFVEKYPAYKGLATLARAAFANVNQRGLPAGDDAIFKAVKDEMDIIRGGPIEEAAAPPADTTPNRTAGTSGGSGASSEKTDRKPEPKKPKSTVELIIKKQQAMGLI